MPTDENARNYYEVWKKICQVEWNTVSTTFATVPIIDPTLVPGYAYGFRRFLEGVLIVLRIHLTAKELQHAEQDFRDYISKVEEVCCVKVNG